MHFGGWHRFRFAGDNIIVSIYPMPSVVKRGPDEVPSKIGGKYIQGITAGIFSLILLYTTAALSESGKLYGAANQIGPIVLFAMCIWGSQRALSSSRFALLMPMPWFFWTCAAYFCLGPLVYHFGTVESIEYNDLFFPVDEHLLLRTNTLNTVGIAFVLVGFQLGMLLTPLRKLPHIGSTNPTRTHTIIIVFLFIGLSIKYVFAFPYYMGWITWTLPGSIQYLSTLSRLSIIVLIVYSKLHGQRLKWLLYAVILEETVIALMTLSKLAVFEVLVAIGLGWYISYRPNIKKIALGGVFVVLFYAIILSPFVSYARLIAGSVGVGSVDELGQTISGFASADEREDFSVLLPGVQSWWTRLSYSNAQGFNLQDYDYGNGGDTFKAIPYAFVPRLFFPEKPIMTPGRDYTTLITGVVGETATSAGIFAEAYWNGGWIAVMITCTFVGFLFWQFSCFTEAKMQTNRLEYLPIIMIGVMMGYSPADWFVSTFVGPLINGFALYILIRFILSPTLDGLRNGSKEKYPLGA